MTCALTNAPGDDSAGGVPHLEVPLTRHAVGAQLRIGVPAGDILLATARPEGLSARNLLPGQVAALRRQDATVVAEVDCGILFTVHLTPAAVEALRLMPGREVWLVIKTYSCHLLEPSGERP